ncbi:MAG: sigma 54-interacting transcriptional regulator [Magnetococcales bacterium]|nr:sigma 54-interacting transcriptional regulator [Magnetococcales bacterium]
MNSTAAPLLLGRSPVFAALQRAAMMVAATEATVLLLGESGTGKELLARAMHQASRRAQAPFVTINCAALPETLAESELFGHAKGAFTGASQTRLGRIASADSGTLFLDEIGELPLTIQAKLLRFLDFGECQALGENKTRQVDVRVIAATNRDLGRMAREGGFRLDLFHRLQVVPLQLPPLRERGGDLECLVEAFLGEGARRHGKAQPRFSREAWQHLQRYAWPGNIRELRNLCERLVILQSGGVVEVGHLPREMHAEQPPLPAPSLPSGGISLNSLEKEMICKALAATGGNRTHAARLLDVSRDTLLYRMKKYALRP